MLFVSKKKDALLRGIPLVLFLAFAYLLSAQAAPPSSELQDLGIAEREDAQPRAQASSGRETDESRILIAPPDGASAESPASASDSRSYSSSGAVLRLVVVLILLCVACYFIIRFLRKSPRASASPDPFLKMVASLPLEQGKSVAVVTLGTRAFLLGVADHAVSLIAEITDAELIDQMNLRGSMSSSGKKSFAEALSELLPKYRDKGDAASAKETAAFIRQRRASLKEKERGEQ